MNILTIVIILGLLTALIHIISMLTVDRSMEYKKISMSSLRIPPEMDGYKIAFIVDVHHISEKKLEDIVSETNDLQPDLLLFGGDFAFKSTERDKVIEILSKIKATDGSFGIQGNHDEPNSLSEVMEQYSIHPLFNSGVHVREHLYVAGVKDLWTREADIEEAVKEAETDDFVLLLAHNPDITMSQDTTSVDLILSGHTHGGHVTFFGVWAPALTLTGVVTKYGQRFMSGWAQSRDGVPVYVSNGVGIHSGLPRVFARPQVIIITLNRK